MRMYDIILKKKNKRELSSDEICFVVDGFTKEQIPDYQMSALLMAICFNGMTKRETADLTMRMAFTGDVMDLSSIRGVKADKHSTGGVGDKTTLIISPIVASLGVKIAKLSGRGLGHTGGTIDKLESIPGLETAFNKHEFMDKVNQIGLCLAGQTTDIAPADKKIYALRDATATVGCIPLIASSIMSKKIAAGADCIVLDVKTGSGALIDSFEGSVELARAMVDIGETAGIRTTALLTDMDVPLGAAVGNILEVIESVEVLKGRGPNDLKQLCIALATEMLCLAGMGKISQCQEQAEETLHSGKAYDKFVAMVESQGGDSSCIEDYNRFSKAGYIYEIKSNQTGFINRMNTQAIGIASCILGAGRESRDDRIDYTAGLVLKAKTGDFVHKNDVLAICYTSDLERAKEAEKQYLSAITYSDSRPGQKPLILGRVDKNGMELY